MRNCTVYIDEAGDLGYRRGTRWFVLTAVIVDKEAEKDLRAIMRQIKIRLNVNELHLRKIPDFYKRAYIVREIDCGNFIYANVVVDTDKLNLAMSASSMTAYNFICRMLLERVSWFLRDTGSIADIVLSARGTSRDKELIDYISTRLIPYQDNQIVSNVFGKIKAMPANNRDLLQLADICATTTFLAYEVNGWGFRTPCFFKVLWTHLYKYNNRMDSYGLKYFSTDMRPQKDTLQCDYACKKKERTPGATST